MADVCPCCRNHCSSDNLKCDRGRNFFSADSPEEHDSIRNNDFHRHDHHGRHHHPNNRSDSVDSEVE